MNSKTILGISINTGSYCKFVDTIVNLAYKNTGSYVCLLNVHMLISAYKSVAFKKVLQQADLITPDGKPISWAVNLLHNVKQERVAGMDLLPDLLARAEQQGISVFFYGGSTTLMHKAMAYLNQTFPLLKISGFYSPPFKELTEDEMLADAQMIKTTGAQMVFVVLGCPKQEKWMSVVKASINVLMIGVGGAMPVMVGVHKRAPIWMQNSGLEWAYRLIQEPKRLFKRYFITNSIFTYLLFKAYLQKLTN